MKKMIEILTDVELCGADRVKQSINQKDLYFGSSAIFYACEWNIQKWLTKFVELGGDINFIRDWSNVPLSYFAKKNKLQL
jgi:hypothetical protein